MPVIAGAEAHFFGVVVQAFAQPVVPFAAALAAVVLPVVPHAGAAFDSRCFSPDWSVGVQGLADAVADFSVQAVKVFDLWAAPCVVVGMAVVL